MSRKKNKRRDKRGTLEERRNARFRIALVVIGVIMGLVAAVTCLSSSP